MTTLHVTDANTGNIVAIDTENPSGSIYVVDSNTGNIVPVDLSSPSGVINAIDEDTGNIVSLDLGNLTGVITVVDANTGNFFDVDFDNPSGLFYTRDEDTGDLVQIDLSTDTFFKAEGLIIPRWQYWQLAIKTLGQSNIIAYWPLWELSGTSVTDIVQGRNGSYTNVTLGQPGVSSKSSASFNGSSSLADVFSTGLASVFTPLEGAMFFRFKVSDVADWTDSTRRDLFYFSADGNNSIKVDKETTNNVLKWEVAHGGVFLSHAADIWQGVTGWQDGCLTWSKSNNRMSVYWNGELVITKTGLGIWAGTLANARFGTTVGSGNWWKGCLSDFILTSVEPTALQVRSLSNFAARIKRFSFLGDSITTGATNNYPTFVANGNSGGRCYRINHAESSASIMANMDGQSLASESDDANAIIISLGTGDNDAGDMAALQSKAESNIIKLKSYNPTANIYWMNVLPRWTDNTGATPVDKSHIRTAIAAACSAQGITCWDTFTIPWITAGQTSDGVHPTVAGHAAIATQVLARL